MHYKQGIGYRVERFGFTRASDAAQWGFGHWVEGIYVGFRALGGLPCGLAGLRARSI